MRRKTLAPSKMAVLAACSADERPLTLKLLTERLPYGPKTLYNTIGQMLAYGWLSEQKLKGVGGPRGYTLTEKGRAAHADALTRIT